MKDVAFVNLTDSGVVDVPMAVTGTVEGKKALLQQVIILCFSDPDGLGRYQGGGLLNDLRTSTISEDGLDEVRNLIAIALTSVKTIIQDRQTEIVANPSWQQLTEEEQLADIVLKTVAMTDRDSLKIELDIVTVEGEPLAAELNI